MLSPAGLLAAEANAVPVPPIWGVALTLLLVAVTAYVALRQRLGLARDLMVATVRAAVQLVAVGYALRFLFEETGLPGSLGWVGGMVVLAGQTAGRRARTLPHGRRTATLAVGTAAVATLGLLVGAQIIEATPRIVLPLGGMVVSAAMTGATLSLSRVADEVSTSRAIVEARLALGLPSAQAFEPHLRLALRASIAPAIDQTKVVGLITLPGAMTGLIIAGVSPVVAIRYQIIVMYMYLGAGTIAALVAGRLAGRTLFDDAHRLRRLDSPGAAHNPRRG
ncbi:MAG TPA: iron export ABC transporter permease subunit FetB [Mycobacteriales bacterium]|nr:iron export ABC transporter permease subunit FetB [Mycobacteriales bacterium]